MSYSFPLPSGHLDRHLRFLDIIQFHHGLGGGNSHANQDQRWDDSPDDFNCRIFMKTAQLYVLLIYGGGKSNKT